MSTLQELLLRVSVRGSSNSGFVAVERLVVFNVATFSKLRPRALSEVGTVNVYVGFLRALLREACRVLASANTVRKSLVTT